MVHAGAAHPHDKIACGQMHLLYDLIWAPHRHSSHTRHSAHARPKLQVTFFFDIDTPLFIQAVFFPDGGVFDRVIIVNRKTLSRVQGKNQQRSVLYDRGDAQLEAARQTPGDQEQDEDCTGCPPYGGPNRLLEQFPVTPLRNQPCGHLDPLFLEVFDGARMERDR